MKSLSWLLLCCAFLTQICLSGGNTNIYGRNFYNGYGNLSNTTYYVYNGDGSLQGQYLSGNPAYLAYWTTYTYITAVNGNGIYGEDFTGTWGAKIKHQYWQEDLLQGNPVTLGYNLSVQAGITRNVNDFTAYYMRVRPVTMQVALDGIVESNFGVYFWDPWKVTNTGWPPEQNTTWNSYATQFTPGTGANASYGGVFQDLTYDPSRPGYKVKADVTKTIDGSSSQFAYWTTSPYAAVTWQTSIETPVTFSSSSAVVTANYKGNLRTGRPDLANTINQRRLIASNDNNNWIMVYESMGDVYLTNSVNGGVNWLNEVRLNVQVGSASNPTISNVLYYNGTNPYYLIA